MCSTHTHTQLVNQNKFSNQMLKLVRFDPISMYGWKSRKQSVFLDLLIKFFAVNFSTQETKYFKS